MRQFTLQALADRASQRIGIKGRIIIWDQAEPCMDVDKPHQLEIMREDLALQKKKESAAQKKALRSPAKKAAPSKKTGAPTKAKAKKK